VFLNVLYPFQQRGAEKRENGYIHSDVEPDSEVYGKGCFNESYRRKLVTAGIGKAAYRGGA
jgi:hypothetical protein